ncbi:DUF4350 domain-containing protein [Nocardioides acrostichi]|uniref:DUF4350 domain-containing protein n=1 Tax=Nocardioides acrostichi TaxID=2784339 RepID=A0A930UY27_9ACTN|nr:DUF4350 domain-containing protein [Nocardioides acrostichi]MBF4162993.1 DUF4350 domain-containing protein [Nocardioides acrostichi]
MSATTTATARSAAAPSPRGRRGRRFGTLLIVAGLVSAVVVALAVGGDAPRTGFLDPDNPDPAGAQAVARVLSDDGIEVQVVRSAAALRAASSDGDATVLVTSPEHLGRSTARHLLAEAAPGTLVIAQPDLLALDALDLDLDTSYAPELGGSPVEADCDLPQVVGLRLEVDRPTGYSGRSEQSCFGADPSLLVVRDGITVLGASELLSNDQIVRADNAAIALRILGQRDRLVWYVPSIEDLQGDDAATLGSLLPPWLGPGVVLVLIALVALVLWRARRLGPLATENLPVVVRAAETTHSQGRLYRRAGDREHAAAALRRATRRRLTTRLRLGRETTHGTFVLAVAAATGRAERDVAALLAHDSTPETDADLVSLADALHTLEKEVHP